MSKNTTKIGGQAEQLVAEHLNRLGYKLKTSNWKNRWCEIDLIMQKNKVIYFVEVKYRSSGDFGDGLDYVTAKKLKQMRFAAELWMSENNWEGDAELLVASVDEKAEGSSVSLIAVEP